MKKFIKIITIIILLLAQTGWSQLENANWYFGDHAGLNFNGSTTVLTDGEITSGSASISDSTGELLFYIGGGSVWNKNNQIIDDITNLEGSYFVIAPLPNSDKKYIIFTSVYQSFQHYDYYYSIINMQDELGDIELINVPTNMPTSKFSDNMVIAKHDDDSSFWLISVTENFILNALLINQNGPTNTIVSSQVVDYFYLTGYEGLSLSVSPDNSKLAFGSYQVTGSIPGNVVPELYIFNFDKITGQITYLLNDPNEMMDLINVLNNNSIMNISNSVEFSEDGNLLYILGNLYHDGGYYAQVISQLDLNSLNDLDNAITYSYEFNFVDEYDNGVPISIYNPRMMCAMDNKIYIPHYNVDNQQFLSVINNPNVIGSSNNFVENQIDLLSGSAINLPYLVPIHKSTCVLDLSITQNVNMSQIDIKESSNTITATNIIFSGATAEYDAGQTVFLKPGFHAQNGSNFRAYIEGCNIDTKPQKGGKKHLVNNNELKTNSILKVYPNPTTNKINIESLSNFKNWKLTNSFGNIKRSSSLSNMKKDIINLNDLPNGLYYLNVIYNNGKMITKTIVKK